MAKFICSKCNYRFESEKAKDCPYCGEKSIEKEKSASELIEEVEKMSKE